MSKQPTYANGKICYLEIPSNDIEASASFYEKCFGWSIRREPGNASFDDSVGEVSGTWVLGRKPMSEPGIVISIMVSNADATSKLITANGGKVVESSTLDSGEVIVVINDPFGNVFGLYQPTHSV